MSLNTILATTPLVSTGYHLKATGTTIGNSLIWDNGTNVGIGNTNTSYTLDVSGTGRFTSTLLVSGAATFSSTYGNVLFKGTNASTMWTEYYYNTSTLLGYIGSGSGILSGAASSDFIFRSEGALVYAIGNSEKMRIRSDGNVAIGSTGNSDIRLRAVGVDSTASNFVFGVANSTPTDLFLVRNDGLIVSGTASASPYNFTTGTGANMVVNSAGHLQRSTSSLKYKTDVRDYDKGLAEVLQMRPIYYKGKNDGDTQFAGLIAEEVHEIGLTEFVQYAEDGTPDALAYANMIALLTKAIQEMNTKIDEQNQTIQNLQEQINILAK